MVKRIINLLTKSQNKIFLFFVTIFFLCLTVPTFLSDNHFLYNLEPYPDGLYYTLSAKNFIEQGRLSLEYKSIIVGISQPPLYSAVLTIGYLLWNHPASFYLVNLFLILTTIIIVTKIVIEIKTTNFIKVISTAFLITHAYWYWIVSLPMTENLSILLFCLLLYLITRIDFTKKVFYSTVIVAILLVLTRIAIIPTAITFIALGFYRLSKNIDKKTKRSFYIIGTLIFFSLNYAFLLLIGKSIFDYFLFFINETFTIKNELSFYNINNIGRNIVTYIRILLGSREKFLWLSNPITSFGIFISIMINIFLNKDKQKITKTILPILLIFLSLFTLLLTFYLSDSRYVIYVIPLYIILFAFTAPTKTDTKYKLLLFILLITHIYSQTPLFKSIISENILHRSKAWQYEATKVIDQFAFNRDKPKIITALPPHFVNAYTKNSITLLPLSYSQEFLQKKQYIWGNKIDYSNLENYYLNEVQNGETIYITNSYITHQQSVIADYEKFKDNFEFVLIQEGCLNSCNIYKLNQKN